MLLQLARQDAYLQAFKGPSVVGGNTPGSGEFKLLKFARARAPGVGLPVRGAGAQPCGRASSGSVGLAATYQARARVRLCELPIGV